MTTLSPPPRRRMIQELRAAGDVLRMVRRLASRSARSSATAKARRTPILLLPGFGAGHRAMEPLRRWLRRQGHEVDHWGLGRNLAGLDLRHSIDDIGPTWTLDPLPTYRGEAGVPLLCDRAGERVRAKSDAEGRPITLIGWSLGGTIAREIARDLPEQVAQVITLGSPVVGGPKYTAAASRLARRGLDLDWIERQVERRQQRPLDVPVTAIVSPTDGVVDANAALDDRSPRTRHRLLDVPHLGMAINPTVWDVILEVLDEAPVHDGP